MKLRVVKNYSSNAAQYRAGEEIEVPDEFGEWLQRDSVECFEEIKDKPPKRSLRKPPADKAMTEVEEK